MNSVLLSLCGISRAAASLTRDANYNLENECIAEIDGLRIREGERIGGRLGAD